MLNKHNLIGNPKVIEELFKKGKIFKGKLLIFKHNFSDGASRFAVSVSKKIYKKANKRNRLRRQIQEGLRLSLPQLKKNIITLVIARPQAAENPSGFAGLKEEILKFFNSIQNEQ